MKVEVKRHLARSLEDGYRLSPCIFVTLSAGKIMQRSQMRKIQTRNLCDPRFERIISIKYDVPNNELDRFDQYKQDIDTFYDKVLEKNG